MAPKQRSGRRRRDHLQAPNSQQVSQRPLFAEHAERLLGDGYTKPERFAVHAQPLQLDEASKEASSGFEKQSSAMWHMTFPNAFRQKSSHIDDNSLELLMRTFNPEWNIEDFLANAPMPSRFISRGEFLISYDWGCEDTSLTRR